MKKLLILATALLCGTTAFAQGVDFQALTYQEALEKAKAENKMVFIKQKVHKIYNRSHL